MNVRHLRAARTHIKQCIDGIKTENLMSASHQLERIKWSSRKKTRTEHNPTVNEPAQTDSSKIYCHLCMKQYIAGTASLDTCSLARAHTHTQPVFQLNWSILSSFIHIRGPRRAYFHPFTFIYGVYVRRFCRNAVRRAAASDVFALFMCSASKCVFGFGLYTRAFSGLLNANIFAMYT